MIDWPAAFDPTFRLAFWTVVVGILANTSSALLGCFLILRRMSMLGDAISHAVLPGLVFAFLLTSSVSFFPMFIGAVIFAMLTAGLSNFLATYGHASEESGLGIVFSSFFALGILLVQMLAENVHLDRDAVLEGAIEYVPLDLIQLGGVAWPSTFWPALLVLAGVLIWLILFWKELKVAAFDPDYASAIGLAGQTMLAMLILLVSVCIVISFKITGSILVVATLVVPAATAQILTHRLNRMLILAGLLVTVATVAGYALSWMWNTSASGMMAVMCGVEYGLALVFSPSQGLIANYWSHRHLQQRIRAEDVLGVVYRWNERQEMIENHPPISSQEIAEIVGDSFRPATLRMLIRQKMLQSPASGLFELTPAGQRAAQRIVRGHRLWETFLETEFGLPGDHLHEAAHQMEHYLDQESRERIEEELGSPGEDPHGRVIPPRISDPEKAD
ncbi:MAG: metal ABC transporter permease [Planctomycetaceae bacterium]|nr:metal ABC transporter permease [Planctomycetaceae bacterium]